MGQKINPTAFRIGQHLSSQINWFSSKSEYGAKLVNDIKIHEYLTKAYLQSGISRIDIQRPADNLVIVIHCARPGAIIGKKGNDIEGIKKKLSAMANLPVHVSIAEVKKTDLDAKIVSENIARQLEKRMQFRRVMKRAAQSAMRAGAKGIKICVSGRVGGAEIARSEWLREGRVPLHTIRADISYHHAEALTTYGIIGVKVWIFRGEVLEKQTKEKSTE